MTRTPYVYLLTVKLDGRRFWEKHYHSEREAKDEGGKWTDPRYKVSMTRWKPAAWPHKSDDHG